MRVSMPHDRSPLQLHTAAAVGLGCLAMVCGLIVGCSSPSAPAPKVASREGHDDHADHGHQHDNEHDHDDHDDHDHPETLAAAVAELKAMWGHVKTALKAGEREKADDKVHAVGHLLEDFEGLLAKEKAESQEAGKQATQEVFDCFDKLDAAFHGDEEDLGKLDLDSLGERLETAIETLEGLVKAGAKS